MYSLNQIFNQIEFIFQLFFIVSSFSRLDVNIYCGGSGLHRKSGRLMTAGGFLPSAGFHEPLHFTLSNAKFSL